MRVQPPRGFTMIELLVTLAVASLLMTIVVSCVVAFQRTMATTESQRGSTESGRDALFELEHSLREAGFGLDPRTTFDFGWFRCGTTTAGIQGQAVCRDSTSGPDNLVFMARNPWYRVDPIGTNGCVGSGSNLIGCPTGQAWTVASISTAGSPTATLQVTQAPVTFYYGQVLEFMCNGGAFYTMGTVSALTTASSPGTISVPLYPTQAGNPYQENAFAPANSNSCFQNNAIAFSVERFGYFIQTFNNVPWLVLDTGLDLTNSGVDPIATQTPANLIPVAPYVEDMQVAYVMDETCDGGTPPGPDSNQNWATGDDRTQATPEAPYLMDGGPPNRIDVDNAQTPQYDTSRCTLNAPNVRAVRVTLDLRSPQPDLSMPSNWFGDQLPQMENETERTMTNAQLGGFHRQVLRTTISPVNMTTLNMFAF